MTSFYPLQLTANIVGPEMHLGPENRIVIIFIELESS